MRLSILLLCVACSSKTGEKCDWDGDCSSKFCAFNRCVTGEVGALCERTECKDGLRCHAGLCRELGGDGADCESILDCVGDMECVANHCYNHEHAVVEKRKLAAKKEADLLAQSGVEGKPAVETPINPVGGGARVRVATATASGGVFAACRSDERLVGGSCKLTSSQKWTPVSSYPSGQSEADTVGARWNCEASLEITAFALCAKIP